MQGVTKVTATSLFLLLAALAGGLFAGASSAAPAASTAACDIDPQLNHVTINQGLPYARLVRGKETLVRFYFSLPASIPKCGSSTRSIKIVSATLNVKNGSTPLNATPITAQPEAINAEITNTAPTNRNPSIPVNSPADPKFAVPGSVLAAGTSGDTYVASFELNITYQSKGNDGVFTANQTATFPPSGGTPITRAVEARTKALRILVVPMGGPLDQAASTAVGTGMTHLSRIFPVPDGTNGTSTALRTAELTSTAGVLRYTVNSGFVDMTGLLETTGTNAGKFCGRSTNFARIQTQLQAFRNAWNGMVNGANGLEDTPQEQDSDKVVGVIPEAASISSANNSGCVEGFAMTNSDESWIRAVSNMAGPLFAMEVCHTFGCVADSNTSHSINTQADTQDPDRAYNVLDRGYIADDKTVMKLVLPWTNENTLMEKDHFAYLLCGFGGANTIGGTLGCPVAPATGTLTGVAATSGTAFVMYGTIDKSSGTATVSSMESTGAPLTAPDPNSDYRLVQIGPTGVLSNEGIPVRFTASHHGSGADSGTGQVGSFNVAYVADPAATRIELRFKNDVLYSRTETPAPTITNVSTGGDDVVRLNVWKSAPASEATPVADSKAASTSEATTQSLPSLRPPRGKVGSVNPRPTRLVHQATTARLPYPTHQFGLFGSLGVGRFFAATYVVNTATDPASPDGVCDATQCTLREAITLANANLGLDRIEFTTPGVDAESALPTITDPVTIDGTQADGTPALIELNGGGTSGTTAGLRVGTGGGGTTIRRLAIVRFPGPGIVLEAGNNVIERNHIGAPLNGTGSGLGNSAGILVQSDDNTIGGLGGAGNLISGNTSSGVFIDGNSFFVTSASRNRVIGNLIGTTLNGSAALGNGGSGVGVSGPRALNNVIGGTTADARNVISANVGGITVGGDPGTANNTLIQGNYIGTSAGGDQALGNTGAGISIGSGGGNIIGGTASGAGNVISANITTLPSRGEGIVLGAPNNTVQGNYIGTDKTGTVDLGNDFRGILVTHSSNQIGGTTAAARNVISGNSNFAVHLGGTGDQANRLEGNYIGTNATGTAAIGNGAGIQINSNGNFVGGAAAGAGNVISASNVGVTINGASNVVAGNLIGTDAAGTGNLGNASRGVEILSNLGTPDSGTQNTIGGTEDGAGNLIAFNGGEPSGTPGGIVVSGSRNAIHRNSIHSNGGLGIDLSPAGVTANDVGDGDAGANNLQNFPVVATATLTGSTTAISGAVDGEAVGSYRLEFFGSAACDGTHGEGRTFIGARTLTSNDQGDVVFEESFSGLSAGEWVTATATDPNGNTSEFSECREVTGSGGGGGGGDPFVVTNTNDSGDGSLRQAITNANNTAGAQTISFAIGTGTQSISPTSALPTVTDPVTIDGTTQPGYSGTPIIQLVGNLAPAGTSGLTIATGSTTVRGLVIRRFGQHGILITGATSTNNVIAGNYIGTDVSGLEDSGNAREGIRVESPSATIGGTSGRNVVSGNNGHGILLYGSTNSTVEGNYVGTNASGTAAIANGLDGIAVDGGSNNTITANVASGNTNQGIAIFGVDFASTSGNTVQGNAVGMDAEVEEAIANGGDGIRVHNGSNTTIGGTGTLAANVIAHNSANGIAIFTDKDVDPNSSSTKTATGNTVSANSIHTNGALGIDLRRDGPTANDIAVGGEGTHDSDQGTNDLQNFPVIRSVIGGTISGDLDSTPSTETTPQDFTIAFYASAACDTSGFGEGGRFLGTRTVRTSSSGRARFTFTPAAPGVAVGEWVTATATDQDGNTSEFSACRQAVAGEPAPEGTTRVTVEGTDQNPQDTRTFVFANCGTRKEPILVDRPPSNTSGNDYEVHFNFDPKPACAGPNGQLTLTVITTDGFATSAPATVTVSSANEKPEPSIATGGPFVQWDGITLHGYAFDADEQLTADKLVWSSPTGLFSDTRTGFTVNLAPSPSWTPGQHQIRLTATDSGGVSESVIKTITILGDADRDGCPTGTDLNDNDRYDAYKDADSDGRYNCEDPQPNVPDTSFTGTATFQPDPLVLPYGGVVTMTMRLLNKNVADVQPSSVRLRSIDGQNVSTDDAFKATSVAVTNTGVLRATFSGTALSSWLTARNVRDRRIVVTMGGNSRTTPVWTFEVSGSTYVTRG